MINRSKVPTAAISCHKFSQELFFYVIFVGPVEGGSYTFLKTGSLMLTSLLIYFSCVNALYKSVIEFV